MSDAKDEILNSADELAAKQAQVEAQLVDSERLLEGEDPHSPYAEDAAHWVGVYSELVAFKEGLLRQVAEDREELSRGATAELERDENLLNLELERLKLRLGFWLARHEELLQG